MTAVNPLTPVPPASAPTPVAPATPGNGAAPASRPPDAPMGATDLAIPKASITGFTGMSTKPDSMDIGRMNGGGFNVGGAGVAPVDRGSIQCTAVPTTEGCRLTVESFHSSQNDRMTLLLEAEVLDLDSNEYRTVVVSVLTNAANLNGDAYTGRYTVDISYDAIEKFLQKRNKNLALTPGQTALAVRAHWNDKDGSVEHRAGSFARGGAFVLPKPIATQNIVTTRVQQSARQDAPMELSVAVAYPKELVQEFPALHPNGSIETHYESEFKGNTDAQSMKEAVAKAYALWLDVQAGKTGELARLLGPDWTMTVENRYWLKADPLDPAATPTPGPLAGYKLDDRGLPIQDVMSDIYMDDDAMRATEHEAAVRYRSNKQGELLNVKPGGGVRDPHTWITQRIEGAMAFAMSATREQAAAVLRQIDGGKWGNTCFAQINRLIKDVDPELTLADALEPWLDLRQDRHKFNIKNTKTGVGVEFSFDTIWASTLRPEHADRDGKPRTAHFHVMEAELNHMGLNASTQGTFQGASADAAAFSDNAEQDKWLKATSEHVTMNIQPRLHETRDLQNPAFRQTSDYKDFEKIVKIMREHFFPKGLSVAKQKSAEAAQRLGIVPVTPGFVVDFVRYEAVSNGIAWSGALDKALRDLVALPGVPEKIAVEIQAGRDGGSNFDEEGEEVDAPGDTLSLLKRIVGITLPPVAYDPDLLAARFDRALEPLGLTINDDVRAFCKKLELSKVSTQTIGAGFNRWTDDEAVFHAVARAQGILPPKPTVSPERLVKLVEKGLANSWISLASLDSIKASLAEAIQKGAKAQDLRNVIEQLLSNDNEAFTRNAKELGYTAPTLLVDADKVVAKAHTSLANVGVALDAEMEKFIREVAQKGSLSQCNNLGEVSEWSDWRETYKKVAKDLHLTLPKATMIPEVFYKKARESCKQLHVVFNDAMKAFVDALIEREETMRNVQGVLSNLSYSTWESSLKSHSIKKTGLTLPVLELKMNELATMWKSRFDKKLTAPLRDYLAQEVPKITAKDDFELKELHERNLDDLLKFVEKLSGVKPPAATAAQPAGG